MRSLFLVCTVLFSLSSASLAGDEAASGRWICQKAKIWETSHLAIDGTVIVNNFLLKERRAIMSNSLGVIEVSFSARNRDGSSKPFNAQVVGLTEHGDLIFALEANPLFDILSPESIETIHGDVYSLGGSLGKTASVCFAFVVGA